MDMKLIVMGLIVVVLISGCTDYPSEDDFINDTPVPLGDVNRCDLEPETGSCKAMILKYYFDQIENVCKEFTWGGCNGVVPFETLEECESVCEISGEEVEFCGWSTYGECEIDEDCIEEGCTGQVCQSKHEEGTPTNCVALECYANEKYGLNCKCVEGECQWS